ncbi:hypothetical protein KCP73_08405 [Salmonella enterica subsp. enterica]|nr:hypothetical protein KCP73_08405 [Salmonella enterica subsp. enterica]
MSAVRLHLAKLLRWAARRSCCSTNRPERHGYRNPRALENALLEFTAAR